MILSEAEIKNLMTTYHGNEAFVIGVAVGKSIEAHKACEWMKVHIKTACIDLGKVELSECHCQEWWLDDFRKAMEE